MKAVLVLVLATLIIGTAQAGNISPGIEDNVGAGNPSNISPGIIDQAATQPLPSTHSGGGSSGGGTGGGRTIPRPTPTLAPQVIEPEQETITSDQQLSEIATEPTPEQTEPQEINTSDYPSAEPPSILYPAAIAIVFLMVCLGLFYLWKREAK